MAENDGLRWEGSADEAPPSGRRLRPPARRRRWIIAGGAALFVLVVAVASAALALLRDDGEPDPVILVDYESAKRGVEASQGWRAVAADHSLVVSLFIVRDPDRVQQATAPPGMRAVSFFIQLFQRTGDSAELRGNAASLTYTLEGKSGKATLTSLTLQNGTLPIVLHDASVVTVIASFLIPLDAVPAQLSFNAPWATPQAPARFVFQ